MTFADMEFSGASHRGACKSRNALEVLLEQLDRNFIFRDRSDLARLVNWSAGKDAPFHRWFRYREAFSPELIPQLNLGKRILDPFCGCGSTLIGAMQTNRSAVGIDLNPLASFVSKVKVTGLSDDELASIHGFLSQLSEAGPSEPDKISLPDLSIAAKVFEPTVVQTLMKLRAQIAAAPVSQNARNFLLLGWLGILETVGSYFKEGNGIKYRKMQRRPGRYVEREPGVWQNARFGSDQAGYVLGCYERHVRLMLTDAKLWVSMDGQSEVFNGNALDLIHLADGMFDGVIFSPPYANRFDYFESMKVELWFGGFVNSYDELKRLRKESLRSHLGADMSRDKTSFEELEGLLSTMDRTASSWRMGVPELLRGYFSDIIEVLKQCRKKLANGACHVVVGNSAFAGTIIPSDVLTAIAGKKAGFTHAEIWITRHLTVAPQQRSRLEGLERYMRESIVVLSP
ncbi:site-specific DNA-methyltransferase (adenine-specific) [Rhizobium sp. BK212]|uniref:SAM-dependent methyltransferase n=1 Tax=Rhizobium sp. BK212 TaxID=2587074 RepID=UPI0016078CDA|nr:SAM-dependent methyltransferase [Rhizobium sp. BK212]MBB4216260.1 site-specific DNA-methyltransferase (adenine-specific) [Rhizobium sp. BK212]